MQVKKDVLSSTHNSPDAVINSPNAVLDYKVPMQNNKIIIILTYRHIQCRPKSNILFQTTPENKHYGGIRLSGIVSVLYPLKHDCYARSSDSHEK